MGSILDKFDNNKCYAIDSGMLLNRLREIRDKLNSLYTLGWDDRRDMAQILYLISTNMVEVKNPEDVKCV